MLRREQPRAGQSGPEVDILAPDARSRGGGCRGRRVGQNFTTPNRAGKLKNWKSEKLNADRTRQDSRIPGFQNCRFSLAQMHGPGAGEAAIPNGNNRAEQTIPGHRKLSRCRDHGRRLSANSCPTWTTSEGQLCQPAPDVHIFLSYFVYRH